MRSEGRVDGREAATLVLAATVTEAFLTFPAALVDEGYTAAWMILLVAVLTGALAFLPMAALMEKFPGKSIVEVGEELLGPWLNSLFVLAYLAFFLVTTASILRQYAERTVTVTVPQLPISAAMIALLVGAAVASSLGLEAMARSARLMLYFNLAVVFLVMVLPYPFWNPAYLFPLWGAGMQKILTAGLLRSSVMGEVLLLALILPALKQPFIRGPGLWSILVAGLVLVPGQLALQVTFPVPVLREMILPSFELSKLIYFGRFVQRLEPVFMPLWAVTGLFKVSIGLYACSALITRALKLPYRRPFTLPLAIIIMALAFIPANVTEAVWVDLYVVHRYAWLPAFVLPALLWAAALFRGKKTASGGGAGAGGG